MTKAKTATVQPNGLAERAMIIKVTINFWSGSIKDPKASAEYAKSKNADANRFHTDKKLVAKESLREMRNAINEGKRDLFYRSLPWGDGGFRIISADEYFTVMQAQRKAAEKYNLAADKFCHAAFEKDPETGVTLFEEGIRALGDSGDASDYPQSYGELRRRYGYNVRVLPIHEANDFRVKMAQEDLDAIRKQMEVDRSSLLADAMRDPYRKLIKVVGYMVERLSIYHVNEDGKAKNTFHDTLVTNIQDLLDVLPSLNITNDPELKKITDDVRSKLTVSPVVLRDDEKVRKNTITEAEKILKKIEDFI